MALGISFPFLSSNREPAQAVMGEDRQLYVDELHGKNFNAALRGKLFVATSAAAGIALIVPATTGNHPTLFNPAGSGVNLSLVRLDVSYVSGNNAPTALEWAVTKNAGAAPATGSPILTGTLGTGGSNGGVDSALVGGAVDSKAKWYPAVNTYTAAPAFYAPTGLSLFTGVAATAVAPFTMSVQYDGAIVIAPATALSLCSQAATTTALFQVALWFEEVPIKTS